MNVINASSSHHIAARPSSALSAIFAAGLLAGVLDISQPPSLGFRKAFRR
jgi:hypothetical protein